MQQNTAQIITSKSLSLSSSAQVAGAIFCGLALIFIVGFLPMAEAHNSAHDARHSFAFPCH